MRIALPLLALFICQGCGYYHKTLSQEAGPPARITKAALYQVLPPSFEKIPKPEDYESEAQWREETRGLAGEFHQAVADEVSSLEITAKVARGGWHIYEVPIAYHGRDYAAGKKIGWRDGLNALWCIIRYGLRD